MHISDWSSDGCSSDLRLIELFRRLGAEGRTVIVSSHVLHEVESMAERVIVVVRGRLAAAGSRRAIRDAMNDVPRQVLVRSAEPRSLAAALVGLEAVAGISVDRSEEHTSELQSLMRISYAVFCLKKKK